MKTKIIVPLVVSLFVVMISLVLLGNVMHTGSSETHVTSNTHVVEIIMSSSRPGCESSGCYLPIDLTIGKKNAVTWVNNDRGFHTVTSGYYDIQDGIFDSGHIKPTEKFTHLFDNSGEFHYYCRLHPWMEGKVIVN